MTDREMLELCERAFLAALTATASKRFMRNEGIPSATAAGGSATYNLVVAMRRKLHDHLGIKYD